MNDTCFYCGALVSGKGHGDHFPIPARAGGVDVVPCCESCHDMKDRFNLDAWPMDWISAVVSDFPNLSRETRLFLAKVIDLAADCMHRTPSSPLGASNPTRRTGDGRTSTTASDGARVAPTAAQDAQGDSRGSGSAPGAPRYGGPSPRGATATDRLRWGELGGVWAHLGCQFDALPLSVSRSLQAPRGCELRRPVDPAPPSRAPADDADKRESGPPLGRRSWALSVDPGPRWAKDAPGGPATDLGCIPSFAVGRASCTW